MNISAILSFTFVVTLITLMILNKIAFSIGLVDQPSERKVHLNHTPLTGGLAIAFGVSMTLTFLQPQIISSYSWILFGALAMVITGAFDDLKNLPVKMRLIIQASVAILVVIGADLKIESLGHYPIIGELQLGYFAYPLTIFAILTGINAVNLIDGLDGLAGGICSISFLALGLFASLNGTMEIATFAIIISVALMSFLSKNMRFPWQKKAKAFLGDAGSTALGFTLACMIIKAASVPGLMSPTTALWIIAIPLIDTLSVIIRRRQNGKKAFKASKDHVHHLLLQKFGKVEPVVGSILVIAIIFAALGFWIETYWSDLASIGVFALSAALVHHYLNVLNQGFETFKPNNMTIPPLQDAGVLNEALEALETLETLETKNKVA